MITEEYIKAIDAEFKKGHATEHTHRPALKSLIEGRKRGLIATNEPKAIKCGAPDFLVQYRAVPIGYIEAKDIGAPLDKIEGGEQLMRYRAALPNLILTDYLEFRWYVSGEKRLTARLGSVDGAGRLKANLARAIDVEQLLDEFLKVRLPIVKSPRELAARMAHLARLVRQLIVQAFSVEGETGPLHALLDGFRRVLISDLPGDQFADMYAQTICYGLFAARCNHEPQRGRFTRQAAGFELPKTNPFLREVFNEIAGPNLDERLVWAVDDLAEVLDRADMGSILADFGKRTRREDPVVHFYETFLAEYDPDLRETRGVYYTPEPVVSYIVQSIHSVLQDDFGLPDGLADKSTVKIGSAVGAKKKRQPDDVSEYPKVLILDPAAGTGTFLYAVVNLIHETIKAARMGGAWSGYVSQHLLPRLFGFELLMAPYAVCHMKLGLLLQQLGYDFGADERLRVYLTNSLEEPHAFSRLPLFATALAKEVIEAGEVKKDKPVMVVLGNPPYSGISVNMSPEISKMIEPYKKIDGQPLGERKIWLHDDYVKFIRFAQERVEQTGYGVVGFITNHGYLDNPTFRGMRKSLMETFDKIYVLDLHGSTKKSELVPEGGRDQNVFDIQQGVAIGIFVKKQNRSRKLADVYHADLWGLRDDGRGGGKYPWLYENSLQTTYWAKLAPDAPFFLFKPQSKIGRNEYEAWSSLKDIFLEYAAGVISARDDIVVGFTDEEVLTRVGHFRSQELSDDELRSRYFGSRSGKKYPPGDTRGWQLPEARTTLRADTAWKDKTIDCLYRPFDVRKLYYTPGMVDWPRPELMNHMSIPGNLSLLTTRSVEIGRGWEHVFVSRLIIQHHTVSLKEVNYQMPLYQGGSLLKNPNLSSNFIARLAASTGLRFTESERSGDKVFSPLDVFSYIYAILHSPTYRDRYKQLLKVDFPRIPLPGSAALFRALADLGHKLIGLHLLEKHGPAPATFSRKGTNKIEQISYVQGAQKGSGAVWINQNQCFDDVRPDAWDFHIGGYRMAEKFLKDRKGRVLEYSDIEHYRFLIAALHETAHLMPQIDDAIEGHGGFPKAFATA